MTTTRGQLLVLFAVSNLWFVISPVWGLDIWIGPSVGSVTTGTNDVDISLEFNSNTSRIEWIEGSSVAFGAMVEVGFRPYLSLEGGINAIPWGGGEEAVTIRSSGSSRGEWEYRIDAPLLELPLMLKIKPGWERFRFIALGGGAVHIPLSTWSGEYEARFFDTGGALVSELSESEDFDSENIGFALLLGLGAEYHVLGGRFAAEFRVAPGITKWFSDSEVEELEDAQWDTRGFYLSYGYALGR